MIPCFPRFARSNSSLPPPRQAGLFPPRSETPTPPRSLPAARYHLPAVSYPVPSCKLPAGRRQQSRLSLPRCQLPAISSLDAASATKMTTAEFSLTPGDPQRYALPRNPPPTPPRIGVPPGRPPTTVPRATVDLLFRFLAIAISLVLNKLGHAFRFPQPQV